MAVRVEKPAPASIKYRGEQYDWVTNYVRKVNANRRKQSLERRGVKAIIVGLAGQGLARYAVYVEHTWMGLLAK